MKTMRLALAIWLGCAGLVWAQEVEQGIIVTGEGRVSAIPDMASVMLGVTETAPTATAAMSMASAAVANIVVRLDSLGVAPRDRQTNRFYLRPVYDNRPRDTPAPAQVIAYEAGNAIKVTVRDLDGLGGLLDSILDVGANDFNGLSFDITDNTAYVAEARKLAVADALLKASQLAELAGVNLGTVLRMTENSYGGGPARMEMAQMRSAMDVPIESGEIDVRSQVTMVFAIAPKL